VTDAWNNAITAVNSEAAGTTSTLIGGRSLAKRTTDRLPASALSALRSLADELDDARALNRNVSDKLTDVGKRLGDLNLERQYHESFPYNNQKQKEEALKNIDSKIVEQNDIRARLIERRELIYSRTSSLSHLIDAVSDWLISLPPDAKLLAAPRVDTAKRSKSPALHEQIDKCRKRIRELFRDLDATDAAPIPSSFAKDLARKEIHSLAERGRPEVYSVIENREHIRWPRHTIYMPESVHKDVPDGFALVAWLHRDALIAAIEKQIDEQANDEAALSDQQRRERFAALFNELLEYEREEEALIREARGSDFNIDRRVDADPRAVLGLSSELPAPKRDFGA
jgi:hypothetical protein